MSEVIPHWLTKQATLRPRTIAIEMEDGYDMTFKELEKQSMSYAKKLAGIGVKKGDHIGVLSTNSVDMIVAIHALSYIGAVVVLLNSRLTTEELTYQIEHAQIKLLLIGSGMKDQLIENPFTVSMKSLQKIKALNEMPYDLQTDIHLNETFTIMYTSGTTGLPKAVVHTYGNHWWSAIGSALNLGVHETDKWLTTLPLFHVGGLSVFLKSVIYGMPVHLLESFDEEKVTQAILHKGVTIASVVTVMVRKLMIALEENTYPDTFRCMLLGGGPASGSILQQAAKKNIPIYQSYGLTETSSQIATIQPEYALTKMGSAGKPLMPAELKIDDPDKNGVGEIVVKGPMVTSMYYQDLHNTKKTIRNGWLWTGDLGYIDDEGFLYVKDRRSDLIISGGENVSPTEIENIIAEIERVKEVGVVGKYHPVWGEVPVAVVVAVDDHLTAGYILEYVKHKLAAYKLPKEVYFTKQLPRNASNKIMRTKLRDLF